MYLVMEYMAGGDLMGLLIKEDIFSEKKTRRFAAQAILAVQSVHDLGYIHRDLKPDNLLLDCRGNLKVPSFILRYGIFAFAFGFVSVFTFQFLTEVSCTRLFRSQNS